MNANTIRYLDDGSIDLIDVVIGDPKDNEVQVQGGACGICSWDIVTAKLGNRMHPMAPPGHEGIGYVTKVGSGVTSLKEGDRVAGGGFATLRNLSATRVYKIPESELADEFWVVEPVSCAVTGLDHCRLRPGDRVAGLLPNIPEASVLHDVTYEPDEFLAKSVSKTRFWAPDQREVLEIRYREALSAMPIQPGLDPGRILIPSQP